MSITINEVGTEIKRPALLGHAAALFVGLFAVVAVAAVLLTGSGDRVSSAPKTELSSSFVPPPYVPVTLTEQDITLFYLVTSDESAAAAVELESQRETARPFDIIYMRNSDEELTAWTMIKDLEEQQPRSSQRDFSFIDWRAR